MTNRERIEQNNAEIAACIELAKQMSGGSSGGAEFNLAFGDTPPEDTSMLWVKTSNPSGFLVSVDETFEGDNRPESITHGTSYKWQIYTGAGAAVVGSDYYTFGGSGRTTIMKFSFPLSSKTEMTATLAQHGEGFVCGAVGTKVYIFGGAESDIASYPRKYLQVYDTENDSITTINSNSIGVYYADSVVNGSNIHIIGGAKGNSSGDGSNKHYIFNTESQTMSTVSDIPVSLVAPACALDNGCIYICGGAYITNVQRSIYKYDIASDTYSKLNFELHHPVAYAKACILGRKLYVFGGCDNRWRSMSGVATYDDIWEYDIDTGFAVKCRNKIHSKGVVSGAFPYGDTITILNGYQSSYSPRIGGHVLERNKLHIIPNNTENHLPIINTSMTRIEANVGEVYIGDENNEAKQVEILQYKDGSWVNVF